MSIPKTPEVIHCIACGKKMHHGGEIPSEWSKIRRCKECKTLGRTVGEYKHCRRCGRKFTFFRYVNLEASLPSYGLSHYGFSRSDAPVMSLLRSWASRIYCEKCDKLSKMVEGLRKEQRKKSELRRKQRKGKTDRRGDIDMMMECGLDD